MPLPRSRGRSPLKTLCTAEPAGVTVSAVTPRTPAAAAGLAPGDRIVAVNGHRLRDAIDFQFHAGDERLELTVERDGVTATKRLRRHGPGLGLELAPPRPGDIATCANKCVFCFIHQLPRGMRRSLYVKDDDFRLSFLHGNYITLSDLDEAALERIEAQRLSPLYISVHATDPSLRHAHLERTVVDLERLHPHVTTTAIVPVGLTRHRERLPQLRLLTADEARRLVVTIEQWQQRCLVTLGSRFVFAADEIYLQAQAPLPEADAYEGFPVAEDGIGLVRRFEDEVGRALGRVGPVRTLRRV